MSERTDALAEQVNGFLDRYSPPRAILNNTQAQQAEVDELLRTMLHFAPGQGYEEFCQDVLTDLSRQMVTRSWPTNGELTRVCKDRIESSRGNGGSSGDLEIRVVAMMVDWLDSWRSQMPGVGAPSRTGALIGGGYLIDERHARFLGFDLDDDQRRKAMDQRMSPEEWDKHTRVLAGLRGISQDEVKDQERKRMPVHAPEQPFKRMPAHRQSVPASHYAGKVA